MLLVLQGAHRRHRLEVVVKARDAHPQFLREACRSVAADRSPCGAARRLPRCVRGAAEERQVTEPASLLSHQQPVDDLPRDQRPQDARLGRPVHEPRQAHRGIQEVRVQRAHVDRPARRPGTVKRDGPPPPSPSRREPGRAPDGGSDTAVPPTPRRPGPRWVARRWRAGSEPVIAVAAVAQLDLLAPLRDDAEGRLGGAVKRPGRRRGPMKVEPGSGSAPPSSGTACAMRAASSLL